MESRIESKMDVETYLARLRYALEHGCKVTFQEERVVDERRDIHYTNRYTIADLFPDESPVEVLKRELRRLTVGDYLRTVKDSRFPKRSEMREFGKTYNDDAEVYIKIRVELMSAQSYGEHMTFVMSFHYAMIPFCEEYFPYR